MAAVGLRRVARSSMAGQVTRFAAIGAISTVAYLGLYALLRGLAPAAVANALALVLTTFANTAANRRLTFGVRGGKSLGRDHLAGLAALAVALLISTAALGLLQLAARTAARGLEVAVLVGANALATAIRFVLLRGVIFARTGTASSATQLERIPS